jgi:hypothetical protein
LFPDNPVAGIVLERFPQQYFFKFTSFAIVYLLLFSVGYFYSSKPIVFYMRSIDTKQLGKLGWVLTILYAAIALSIVSISEIMTPVGYLGDYYAAPRGMLSTLYLVAIWWYIYLKTISGSKLQQAVIIAVILLTGLNLLTLGTRLAVVSGIISLLVFYIIFVRKALPTKKAIVIKSFAIAIAIALVMSSIGLLRGVEAISAEGLLSIFAAEPVFIYASVLSYFDSDPIYLFAIPWDLITGVIGSIPSFLFPDKADFFLAYSPRSDDAYAGFGGVHHIVSLLSNFGLLGFPIVAFIEGACLGLLIRRVNVNAFYRAASLSSIGLLTFILYREGLQAPVKLFLFNFMLFPFVAINFLLFIKSSVTVQSPSISKLVP